MDALRMPADEFDIALANVGDSDVANLIEKHFELMRSQSPPEACHVKSAQELAVDGTDLMVLRIGGRARAIGALRDLGGGCGEIKSMHTAKEARGRGIARHLLSAIIVLGRSKKMTSLYLETGSGPEHGAARALYKKEGFTECPPFGEYNAHPLSLFMMRTI